MLTDNRSHRSKAVARRWKASANELAILRHLHTVGPTPRSRLAAATGLTNAAISRITRRLVEQDILKEGREVGSLGKPGRRFIELDLGTNAYVLGIGVQAVTQWVELMNLQGKIIKRQAFAVPNLSDSDAVLAQCCEEAERLATSMRISAKRILAVGVGIAGVVDIRSGTVLRAENLGWTQVAVRETLERCMGLPVYAENLRNCMILGSSRLMNGRECRSAMMVIASLGIGASIIIDRHHLISGSGFAAGQIGHTHVEGARERCACGRIGCLDTVASGRALLRRFDLLEPATDHEGAESSRATLLFTKLSERTQSDPDVAEAFRQAGRALGSVLGTAVTLVDPDCIFLTGMLVENDFYFSGVQERLQWYHDGTSAQHPRFARVSSQDVLVPARVAFARLVASSSDHAVPC